MLFRCYSYPFISEWIDFEIAFTASKYCRIWLSDLLKARDFAEAFCCEEFIVHVVASQRKDEVLCKIIYCVLAKFILKGGKCAHLIHVIVVILLKGKLLVFCAIMKTDLLLYKISCWSLIHQFAMLATLLHLYFITECIKFEIKIVNLAVPCSRHWVKSILIITAV